ncbi:hypothetical protein E2C01_045626 [Portunus trituberculatus]|uniref:Uncharacterized protein n=1 Tax=Portunus trituberculatus TaxID=210409 RepID=A0A5B7G3H7_PORTR|nr:hypothetical protein [Portunus trituberculatus]
MLASPCGLNCTYGRNNVLPSSLQQLFSGRQDGRVIMCVIFPDLRRLCLLPGHQRRRHHQEEPLRARINDKWKGKEYSEEKNK